MSADSLVVRLQTIAVSVVILVTLTLQVLAAFTITPGPIERSPFSWPFLDYPMYSQPRYRGEPIERRVVVGIRPDSSEVVVTPADLGVTFWQIRDGLDPAIEGGVSARADVYRQIYESRHGRPLIGFRLEDRPIFITDDGLSEGSATVLGTVYFEPEGAPR
jgi:hypothetical protein